MLLRKLALEGVHDARRLYIHERAILEMLDLTYSPFRTSIVSWM
jgi:hypothetical protein